MESVLMMAHTFNHKGVTSFFSHECPTLNQWNESEVPHLSE